MLHLWDKYGVLFNNSVRHKIMKTLHPVIYACFTVVLLQVVGCKKTPDQSSSKVELILGVYDPENPGSVQTDGEWDGAQVRVFLNGQPLGTTPIEFTTERLRALKLPTYQRIDLGNNSHWMTWDGGGHGGLKVADPNNREHKRRIELRPLNDDSEIQCNGHVTEPTEADGIRFSVTIRKNSRGESGPRD